jgi:hypothetical protein
MAYDQEVMTLNPCTVYWMDVSNTSYYIQEKNKNKGSQMGKVVQGPFTKYVLKWARNFGNTVKPGLKELYGHSKMCLF